MTTPQLPTTPEALLDSQTYHTHSTSSDCFDNATQSYIYPLQPCQLHSRKVSRIPNSIIRPLLRAHDHLRSRSPFTNLNADMVAPPGLIVLAVVVVAAGAAAYENPQVREWIENSRRKIAVALHSLGDEINPPRERERRRSDRSMREDRSEEAEERRRRARAEILEKGRIYEERRRRQKQKGASAAGSFDTLVEKDGTLRQKVDLDAKSTAIDPPQSSGLHKRQSSPTRDLHQSVDMPIPLRHLKSGEPFSSDYEREMSNTWNLPLPHPAPPSSAHESESLINFTPTSEYPGEARQGLEQTEFFSLGSNSSHTLSESVSSPPANPLTPASHPAPSVASSIDHINHSEAEASESDGEYDGIRTPGSAWTDVGSVVSSDAGH